jgi:hypothetical protein
MLIIGATRHLKIEAAGDYWVGQVRPKIRLMGRWLEQAGFQPGDHVTVISVAPGILELRTSSPTTYANKSNDSAGNTSVSDGAGAPAADTGSPAR